MSRAAALILCCTILLATGGAQASGFLVSKMGGDLSGPTEDNAASVFWNPAAIGQLDTDLAVMADCNFIWRWQELTRAYPADMDASARAANPGRMNAFAPNPMIALVTRPGWERVRYGLAVYAPYGHRSDWHRWDIDAEREKPAEDQAVPAQAYHSLESGITILFATGALSVQATDWLWLGASFSLVHAQLDSIRTRDWAPDLDEALGGERPRESLEYTGLAGLDFSGIGWSWSLGALARPRPWLRLGLSFTAGSDLSLGGQAWLSLPPPILTALYGDRVESKARLEMKLPAAIRAGLHWDIFDWLTFRIHAEYIFWSAYDEVRVRGLAFANENGPVSGSLGEVQEFVSRRDWRDAMDVRAGFRFFVHPDCMLFAGVGYDGSAAPDASNTPELFDAEKLGLAGGTRLQLIPLLEWLTGREWGRDDGLALTLGLSWVRYFTTEIEGNQADPPVDGVHDSQAWIFNTNLEWRL